MTNLADLKKFIADKGYKMTRNRTILLQVLLEQTDWRNAREIYSNVLDRAHKIDFSTIYRNLDILTAIGLLSQVERADAVKYYALNQASGNHHHHLICRSCHRITELKFCPLIQMDAEILQNFTEVECKFDLYGFCHECQQKGKLNNMAGSDD